LCFFFQAVDGIRDFHVTGVQTCALPILMTYAHHVLFDDRTSVQFFGYIVASCTNEFDPANCSLVIWTGSNKGRQKAVMNIDHPEIGRASCRERAWTWGAQRGVRIRQNGE